MQVVETVPRMNSISLNDFYLQSLVCLDVRMKILTNNHDK